MSVGPSWQWPQWPIPHCMLRSIETYTRSAADARPRERGDGEAHHHLRPAEQRRRAGRVELGALHQARDDADVAEPLGPGAVDGHLHLAVPARATTRSSSA